MTKRAPSTKALLSGGLASLAVILIIVLWALESVTGVDLGWSDALPELLTGTPEADSGWYQLYFTAPAEQPGWSGGLDETLAADIDQAKRSVDVAAYDFDLQSVTDALLRAHRRGVAVRVVTDSDNVELDQPQELLDGDIPLVEDERGAIMHNKFVVIDGQVVWTGSWNLTDNGTYRNDNNAIRLVSAEMAANYTAEFEEMFLEGRFGPTSPADTPSRLLTIAGTPVETLFAPEDGVMARVIELVSQARDTIRFMAFSFTDESLAQAMLERAQADVLVEGVLETRGSDSIYSQYTLMKDAGLRVWLDGNPAMMHHKVIVIDRKIVITGSFNFTGNADTSNDENLLIIANRDLAAQFLSEFDRVVSQARP